MLLAIRITEDNGGQIGTPANFLLRILAIDHTHQYLRGPESREAHRIIARLRESGFVAYLAGGCVRDALLGQQPKDYDVATDATPESIREVFGKSRTLAFGASFGVIGVLPPRGRDRARKTTAAAPTEVATFRSDGYYSDGRRPDSVHYGDAKHDAQRRDFTINGLFYDPQQDVVVDYVGGQADLDLGLLRTIGDPLERFGEDKLRMLRAVRFATTLGFKIDDQTRKAIIEHADDIAVVSGERIGAEMRRVLSSEHAVEGVRHLLACKLEQVVLPEIATADLNRLEALIRHAAARDFPLCLTCLLMAMQKPDRSLREIAARWRLSNEETRKANAAMEHWSTIASAENLPWSTVQPLLIDRDVETIVQLAATMVKANSAGGGGVALAKDALGWPKEKLDPPPLLTGDDLRSLGIPAGPDYRRILQSIRDAQLNGKISSREEAIRRMDR
jgi:tRNA nucleotidyltransferase (CCA-adding enzyme)